jgi:adenylate kinase family enzyme
MRISVMGVSGAGKSTLGVALAERLGLQRVELDALNWLPGWRDLHGEDPQAFVDRVEAATRGERWVTDGNYTVCQDLVWSRATDVIWLDYPLSVSMPRLLRRTLNRAVTGRELWAGTGNREHFSRWFDKDHPVWFTLRHRTRANAKREARFADPQWSGLRLHRVKSPREAEALVERLVVLDAGGGQQA